MTLGIGLLVAICLLYVLLVKGLLWKLIVAFFGWLGMFVALGIYFPESKNICFNAYGYNISWSQVIPSAIILLAMMYTRDN